jgi:hypothetical protein
MYELNFSFRATQINYNLTNYKSIRDIEAILLKIVLVINS